jgi:hypothetical protein
MPRETISLEKFAKYGCRKGIEAHGVNIDSAT